MKQKPFRSSLFYLPLLLALCLSATSAPASHTAVRALQEAGFAPTPEGLPASSEPTVLHIPIINASAGGQIPNPTVLIQPSDEAVGISTSPVLEVVPAGAGSGLMDVTFYGRPLPVPNLYEDFTLIALPDTQFYSRWLPSIYISQTQWIADNQNNLNIAYTAHLGDIVDNAGDTSQWDAAEAAMSLLENPLPGLDNGIPYGMVPGNHDYPTAIYNNYFSVSRCTDRDYYGGHFGGDNDNNYTLFSASGMDFIVINLEFQPGTDVLDWADDLLKNNPGRRAIVVSHSMLNIDNTWSYQGIYDSLKDNLNLFLMLNGHTHSPTDGAAQRIETGDQGNTIYVLMSNYQGYPEGGGGYLREMRFSPMDKKIYVQTYSPWLEAYLEDTQNEFELAYDMTIAGAYQNLGTVSAVASGENAAVTWADLDQDTGYEWYVEVTDNVSTTSSAAWRFTTWSTPPICYVLSLTKSGLGGFPEASPHNSYGCPAGEYQAGERITLIGAVPAPGWDITGWNGTDDDSNLESSNTLSMPNSNHSTGVIYADITPPNTGIFEAPPNPSASGDASFTFSGSEPGVSFECQLDISGFSGCGSPKDYTGLEDGEHTFQVRALDSAGNPDLTPAAHIWTIDTTSPETVFTETRINHTDNAEAVFRFTSSEFSSTFECQLDSLEFTGCKSPQTFGQLDHGQHSFAVRAVDRAGNPDSTPASVSWMVFRRTYFAIIIN